MADIDNSSSPTAAAVPGSPGLAGAASSPAVAVQTIVDEQLAPLTTRIDREGYYPEPVLRALGETDAYRHHLASQSPGGGADLGAAIDVMRVVSQQCLSTGFMMWCQNALGWYLENSGNNGLKASWLPAVAAGTALGGTALSNPMKYFSGIEPLQLKAQQVAGGVIINGTLPWVSNLGADHGFAAICQVGQNPARDVMVLVPCDNENLRLTQLAHFSGMEGTGTYACHFKDVFVSDELIIAEEVEPFIQRIKAGFILLQAGMAVGLVESCIGLMDEVEPALGHVNCYLDDRPADLLDEV
ncbi:MAG: acyl-CoA dehydrogenase family protein, partial [Gammaproteobacteria bacterium]